MHEGDTFTDAEPVKAELQKLILTFEFAPKQLLSLYLHTSFLTHWLPIYKYIILGNRGKTRDISVDLPTT